MSITDRARERAEEARAMALGEVSGRDMARVIDNTFLHPEATAAQIRGFVEMSAGRGFRSLVVGPAQLDAARSAAGNERLVSVVGFPMGFYRLETKMAEAELLAGRGVFEIDYVVNIGLIKEKDWGSLVNEAKALLSFGIPLKAILEMGLLSDEEKQGAAEHLAGAGVSFIKTSTGFLAGGATLYDVALLSVVLEGSECGVKASGGIRTLPDAQRFLAAGADVLGTSSGLKIVGAAEEKTG